jgi:prepilin peptidase CpaA
MIHAVQTAVLMLFPALVILGGVRDLVSYRIPNWISLALIASFLLAVVGLDLALGVGALAAGAAMFALGWIGGGDAKLFAAAALWLGWPAAQTYLMVTALSGGLLSLLLLSLRASAARSFVLAGPAWFVRLAAPGESVPYGVAIAVGALAAFPASTLVQAAVR